MRIEPLKLKDYEKRIKRFQEELKRSDIDLFIGYSSECESATSRYLSGFWPFFDFAAVLVPAEGDMALVTGGPESLEFAKESSFTQNIFINPLLVETSAPEWVIDVEGENFSKIIPKVCAKRPNRVGIGNYNIFPNVLLEDIKEALSGCEIIPADDILLRVQAVKEDCEIPFILKAYEITESSLKKALAATKAGMREWEIEAAARSNMVLSGAEGMPYPSWVCSGPNTRLSLARSTDRAVSENELIQLTIGTKYMGYCGNMCRPFAIGKFPEAAKKLADVALEAMHYVLNNMKPGVNSSDMFQGYYNILSKYGYENYTLYGPAHGTGSSEVEGLWLSKDSDFIIEKNMLFNIDIWLSDNQHGLRFEDGILITKDGVMELTSYKREVIVL